MSDTTEAAKKHFRKLYPSYPKDRVGKTYELDFAEFAASFSNQQNADLIKRVEVLTKEKTEMIQFCKMILNSYKLMNNETDHLQVWQSIVFSAEKMHNKLIEQALNNDVAEKVHCNCGWIGEENELEYEDTNEGKNFSEYALCPKCKIDLS